MSKRIITTYGKLNGAVKKALHSEYPNGAEMHLSKMKHLIKGYLFDGLVFVYQDITYLIEWYKHDSSITYFDSDIEDNDDDETIAMDDLEDDDI